MSFLVPLIPWYVRPIEVVKSAGTVEPLADGDGVGEAAPLPPGGVAHPAASSIAAPIVTAATARRMPPPRRRQPHRR
ncbi:hypothetical protein NUM_34820 [Actinocatenispora comari]|uniref:Uncharacterized protein n=1 Tax=Actinocatenispora comari TaxID=2807577 RepID=A0A8J4AC30_9ACTN|nr:hypothetical protein NUM_34820 [Actinocatenispora comari]